VSLVEKNATLLSTSGKCISKHWNIVKRTLWISLLLSLLLLSCTVVLKRKLANTLNPFTSKTQSSTTHSTYNNSSIDIEIDTLRGRLAILSINVSKETSAHSSISFILYIERIEAQNNNLS